MLIDPIVVFNQKSDSFKNVLMRFFSQDQYVLKLFSDILKEHILLSTSYDRHLAEMGSRFTLLEKQKISA